MENIATRLTGIGTLEVDASGYDGCGYPGYVISLSRNGKKHEAVMVEVDETEDEPRLKVHVWNCTDEDPVFDLAMTAEELDNSQF
jgi:hypothetical protein